ncbi:GPR1/FUN34/YaaH family transporter [Mycobacterium sp. NPDC006124]|uniref:GPR1/FUN34/YaaH family transporter n=1 Tax=Mycobacterium sp. NPDC006124 TaxID=3156729 RepID=UPI0033A58759
MTDLATREPLTPAAAVSTVDVSPPVAPVREGNPGLLALPLVIAGGFGLGFTNTGIVDVAAAAVPILLSATSIGLLLATVWAAALGQNVNATVYGVFFGFYASYAALSLGLTHDWFGISAADAGPTTALWLGSWLLTIGLLTVLVLRLPWTYPLLLGIVDVALVSLLIGNLTGSAAATHAGGWFVFAFVALVAYYYVAALWEETGGRALPLGRPLVG